MIFQFEDAVSVASAPSRRINVSIRRSSLGFLGLCREAGGSFVDEPKQSTKQRPSRGTAAA